jgi:hypothetical protein
LTVDVLRAGRDGGNKYEEHEADKIFHPSIIPQI